MYVGTLDILTEKGGFEPQAARAIGEAIDLEIARSRNLSAIREDLSKCRRTLSDEIEALRTEVKGAISSLRAEVKQDISSLRTELKRDINELRVQVQAVKADLVRWVFVAITGQTAILLGVVYFFMRYLK